SYKPKALYFRYGHDRKAGPVNAGEPGLGAVVKNHIIRNTRATRERETTLGIQEQVRSGSPAVTKPGTRSPGIASPTGVDFRPPPLNGSGRPIHGSASDSSLSNELMQAEG